ncbi:MAG: sortase [Anaerolineae bacterium]
MTEHDAAPRRQGGGLRLAAHLGRAAGLATGFVTTSAWGWRLALGRGATAARRRRPAPKAAGSHRLRPVRRLVPRAPDPGTLTPGILGRGTLPGPRALLQRFVAETGNVLIAFGLALLVLAGAIRVSRAVRLATASQLRVAPRFEASVAEAAPRLAAGGAADPVDDAAPADLGPPDRIVVPAIAVDEEVRPVGWSRLFNGDNVANVWDTANYAVGFHKTSAPPGEAGNTVVSGHNNILGSVFSDLYKLEPGNKVYLYAGDRIRAYKVEQSFIVKEAGASPEERRANARWIEATADERLTMVSCYPPWSNTHRAIVVAKPVEGDPGPRDEADILNH